MREPVSIAVIIFLLVSGLAAGCGDSRGAAGWLEECGREVESYAGANGYVHFVQEMENILGTAQGEFEQVLRVEGDIIFPDRESYRYEETVSSSLQPGQPQENSFSYLTLDRGATAYVMGERLSQELGVAAWIHYTPASGQNRYFDYAQVIGSLVTMGREPEWLGYEDAGGESCAHVRYSASGQDLIDMRIQSDPYFAEQYEGLDLGEALGELSVEFWIGEADGLPRRVFMEQSIVLDGGTSRYTRVTFTFSAYGEKPPLLIEAPAFSHEAV